MIRRSRLEIIEAIVGDRYKDVLAELPGIITTNDAALAETCISLHNCGRRTGGVWYEHHINAVNYRLGELQGALLNSQLERLEEQTKTREANGRYLAERQCRQIVVACNTASVAALVSLRQDFPQVPFVGMEPAVMPPTSEWCARVAA